MLTAQLITKVQMNVGDPTGDRYGMGRIMGLLQEGLRDLLRECSTVYRATTTLSADLSATPAYAIYTLPDDCHLIEGIRYLGRNLKQITVQEAGEMWSEWETETGTPDYFLTGYWGRGRVRLLPYLTEAIDPTIYYVRHPESLLDSDTPDLDPAQMDYLEFRTTWRILGSEPDGDARLRDFYADLMGRALMQAKGYAAKGQVQAARSQRRGTF